ncbi:MAG: HTH domain-containing protein [Actinobacteria bacterium]|nr:HTH domain-containing protein [Actinomycetota bacterium]
MESPPGRLLRLLSLLQSRSEISGPELGEHLGVSTRTVRRDIDRLRTMGYPVDSAVGINGSYRLAAGAEVPPMLFDRDEVVSLTVALRRLHGSGIGPMSGAAARALRKLERVLPPELARQAETLAAMTVTVGEVVDPALTPAAMARIASACSERLQLRFGYVDRDGAATERRVEPLRLVSMGRNWYLVAFDLDPRLAHLPDRPARTRRHPGGASVRAASDPGRRRGRVRRAPDRPTVEQVGPSSVLRPRRTSPALAADLAGFRRAGGGRPVRRGGQRARSGDARELPDLVRRRLRADRGRAGCGRGACVDRRTRRAGPAS